ncbi:flavodoxin [Aureimonas altamirensis]|uniref:flavodoxin n=1 Tax=Aureimonas altamirensis TaxID=370622 RepID=UPI001E299234|nr:flavodoxin [Aureimonas altamirensis]UHD46410.1 flavodoxin [Aureimonas altamirensis]
MKDITLSRRSLIAGSAVLALSGAAQAQATGSVAGVNGSRILVAWFSRSGNTTVIAGQIRRATGANAFTIEPATPYPEDYEETVAQSRRERDAGFEPELATLVDEIASYETVYLGFPIWSGTVPHVIRSFLSRHDLAGKTVIPFITHGGYGVGSSEEVLARHAPDARIAPAFVMEADQERRTMESVNGWLAETAAR